VSLLPKEGKEEEEDEDEKERGGERNRGEGRKEERVNTEWSRSNH
jgi:hypothetical protein